MYIYIYEITQGVVDIIIQLPKVGVGIFASFFITGCAASSCSYRLKSSQQIPGWWSRFLGQNTQWKHEVSVFVPDRNLHFRSSVTYTFTEAIISSYACENVKMMHLLIAVNQLNFSGVYDYLNQQLNRNTYTIALCLFFREPYMPQYHFGYE